MAFTLNCSDERSELATMTCTKPQSAFRPPERGIAWLSCTNGRQTAAQGRFLHSSRNPAMKPEPRDMPDVWDPPKHATCSTHLQGPGRIWQALPLSPEASSSELMRLRLQMTGGPERAASTARRRPSEQNWTGPLQAGLSTGVHDDPSLICMCVGYVRAYVCVYVFVYVFV